MFFSNLHQIHTTLPRACRNMQIIARVNHNNSDVRFFSSCFELRYSNLHVRIPTSRFGWSAELQDAFFFAPRPSPATHPHNSSICTINSAPQVGIFFPQPAVNENVGKPVPNTVGQTLMTTRHRGCRNRGRG